MLSTSQVAQRLALVQLLTTGGTIAGVAPTATSASYQAAAKRGEDLLSAVPGLERLATLRVTDVVAKDSADLRLDDWLKIYQAVCQSLADPAVDAVVITHGTDTLEETAFFLDTLLRSDKPVVLVGAMRPATALSADGPLNLLNAVAVAISPSSIGRGVLVVMNDNIMAARDATKSHTCAVQAFASPHRGGMGAGIGSVYLGDVHYTSSVGTRNALREVPFAGWSQLDHAQSLPRVDIVYVHAGMSLPLWQSSTEMGARHVLGRGVVLAGTGAGNVPADLKESIREMQSQGVVVVRSTRVWAGGVIPDYQRLDTDMGLICAGDLSPHKARILLMLALRFSTDVREIRRCFTAS